MEHHPIRYVPYGGRFSPDYFLRKKFEAGQEVKESDILECANSFIQTIKTIKTPKEKTDFIVSFFSYEDKSLQQHTDRIRSGIVEKIKDLLLNDPDLQDVYYSNVHIFDDYVSNYGTEKKHLYFVSDLNNGKQVYKRHREHWLDDGDPVVLAAHERAMRKLASLPLHPNIITPQIFEANRGDIQSITPKVVLEILSELQFENTTFSELLATMRDALRAAAYLEANGLILQDISLGNIARITESGSTHGAIFDLEGLLPEGFPFSARIANPTLGYLPPETADDEEKPIRASESVYQFGRCLANIIDTRMGEEWEDLMIKDKKKYIIPNQEFAEKIDAGANSMLDADPAKRPTLTESIAIVEDLLQEAKKINI